MVLQMTGTLVTEGAEERRQPDPEDPAELGSEEAVVQAQALELSPYRNRSRTLRRQELHADRWHNSCLSGSGHQAARPHSRQ